jgi:hypothetical protein
MTDDRRSGRTCQPQADGGRESVAEFVELDDAFEALDALTATRAPTRRERLAAIEPPDETLDEPPDGKE